MVQAVIDANEAVLTLWVLVRRCNRSLKTIDDQIFKLANATHDAVTYPPRRPPRAAGVPFRDPALCGARTVGEVDKGRSRKSTVIVKDIKVLTS